MKRRTWILGSAGVITTSFAKADHSLIEDMGSDFKWGVANAAFQVEGAASEGGRSMTIWDDFTKNSSNIKDGSNVVRFEHAIVNTSFFMCSGLFKCSSFGK